MLWWLVDHATLVYFLLGIAALASAALWWMNRQRPYLIALGVILGLASLVWLLGLLIVTDRQQIRAQLFAMRDAVEAGNADAVFKHLAKDFRFGTMERAAFVERAGRAIRQKRVHQIIIWNLDFEVPPDRDKRHAVLAFHVRGITDWGEQILLCRTDFVFEDQQWRLKQVRFFNPVANTDQPMQIAIP